MFSLSQWPLFFWFALSLLIAGPPFSPALVACAYDEERLPGWKGESPGIGGSEASKETKGKMTSPVEVLSWDPRSFVYRGFLSDEECDHLIELAKPRMKRSGVVDTDTGGSTIDNVRTSSGTFFKRKEDAVIEAIEERIAAWTLIAPDQGEGIQVLQYEYGQKYTSHYDYFFHDQANDNGGNRMATVLMYLNDVEFGGETNFPKAEKSQHQLDHPEEYSECGHEGLAFKPKKGDALLFFSIKTTGELERTSLHGGCPVIRGVKWSATKWIHIGPYADSTMGMQPQKLEHKVFAPPAPPVPPGCEDRHKMCSSWAAQGECDANKAYMLGEGTQHEGGCLVSCNACHLMKSAVPTDEKVELRHRLV